VVVGAGVWQIINANITIGLYLGGYMEKGLLSTIRSWYVDEELSDDNQFIRARSRGRNTGRLIQLALLEFANREPKTFERIVRQHFSGLPPGSLTVKKEYFFETVGLKRSTKHQKIAPRFADLAIFSKSTDQLLVLVEIKYDDNFIKQKQHQPTGQLTAYIKECKRNNSELLVLSKNILSTEEKNEILQTTDVNIKSVLFGDLGNQLKRSADSTIAHLLYDFFKDEGLIMQKIDTDLLYRFFHRLVNPWNGAGKIQALSFAQGGAGNFQILLNNMSIVSNSLAGILSSSGKKPNIDFSITPTIKSDSKDLLKAVAEKADYDIQYRDRVGGQIFVYAISTLFSNKNNSNWLNIQYGYGFSVKANSEKHIDLYLYAQVSSRALNDLNDAGFAFSFENIESKRLAGQLCDKGDTESKFLQLIRTTVSNVIDSGQLSDLDHKNALKVLRGRLG